jgi:hypothetical protein
VLIPNDDEQFKSYLKQFRPVEAEPLPAEKAEGIRLRRFVLVAAAAALLVIVAGAAFWYQRGRITPREAPYAEAQPARVTLGQAEAALAQDSSFDEALDRLERTSKPQPTSQPANHAQSALQVLGREEL